MRRFPKRLIEVDLPIKRISEHARCEKSVRNGHISTLHIWWARRPLAACRAVICAALWPDPADPDCPQRFRDEASLIMNEFARNAVSNKELAAHCSHETWGKWQKLVASGCLSSTKEEHWNVLRDALLDFIADFADWDNSSVNEYLETSHKLTQLSHEALGGAEGTRPLVVDSFAGGGSIPLEALRVGADAFASDLNPVATILNKIILEYLPKYGQRLADEVGKWSEWIKLEAEKELEEFYPRDPDGSTPIAYLWARTIKCEGPGCGAVIPLTRTLWLAKQANRSVALQLVPNTENTVIGLQLIVKQRGSWVDQANPTAKINNPKLDGTVKRGSATCPRCGYTTPVARVRAQLKTRHGGTNDPRLLCVVTTSQKERGRSFRLPMDQDSRAVISAARNLEKRKKQHKGDLSLVPDESTAGYETFVNRGSIYGMTSWEDFFTSRQLLTLTTLAELVRRAGKECAKGDDPDFAVAVQTCLAIAVDRQADRFSSLVRWACNRAQITNTFGRQALPMVWDFAEPGILDADAAGNFGVTAQTVVDALERLNIGSSPGTVQQASACMHPLPNDSAQAFITDPPYYFSVQYADISDFFYVWLRRMIGEIHPQCFALPLSPKEDEVIVQTPAHQFAAEGKNNAYYEARMQKALEEGRRILVPSGIGTIVFAHTSTAGWEAMLKATINAGWCVTASWPIDTEMSTRVIAQGRSVLASSVHLVCRPRETSGDSLDNSEVGDWRDVLLELPRRIHDWMPRLAREGVVGADAIFACLGPALEIFSRYSSVEKASGEQVSLKEYLEYVWAAVSKEALNMIFEGADATGFEEDARLTAMWLWTLSTDADGGDLGETDDEVEDQDDGSGKIPKMTGFVLEYDAARKIAQGLGAHLEQLSSLVEVSGDKARLLPVSERAHHLFGKDEGAAPTKRKGKPKQLSLLDVTGEADESGVGWGEKTGSRIGSTVLDRIQQCMILFAAGRGEAVKRFLVNDGVGQDQRFWRLAQALSALYPKGTDERRWVEGVLARKKGLGF
jgi:putative DNA methylase